MPCIVNAANEVVVASFLKDQISFLGMSDVIEKTHGTGDFHSDADLRGLCRDRCLDPACGSRNGD